MMRYSILLFIAVIAGSTLLTASPGLSQQLKEKRISVTFEDQTLDQCIKIIGVKCDIGFAYKPEELNRYEISYVRFKKENLESVLQKLLLHTDLEYRESGKNVVVFKKPDMPNADSLLSTDKLLSVQDHITGKVVDESGAPIIGATVQVKGTSVGAATDVNGSYAIEAQVGKDHLLVSAIGYQAKDMLINSTEINITLLKSVSELNPLVVIGYGTQKRTDVTASISSVSGSQIKDLPATNVEEALQGRMAGVQVIKSSGAPDATANIYIRGISSINNPAPLYIVDGVRSSGDNINLQDIASIDVLKDASAAAIYGSAAAGGVILITTKKGQLGKPVVHFSARYGVVKPELRQLLNTNDFVKLQRYLNPSYLQGASIDSLPNTNWVDALYGNGNEENYNLSVSGATKNVNYMISAFYNKQKGIYIDNSSYLSGARINSDLQVTKRIKIGERIYINQRNTNPTNGDPGNPPFRTQPVMPIYDSTNADGGGWGKTPPGFNGGNPVGNELTYIAKNTNFNVQANAYAEIKLPLYLTLKTTVSYGYGSGSFNQFQKTYNFGNNVIADNSLEKSSSYGKSLLDNFTLNFNHTFGKHSLDALIGYEQTKSMGDGIDVKQSDQAIQPGYTFFPTSTSQTYNPSGTYDNNGLIKSEFGRLNYNYADKYYVSAAFRRDGDFTHFGPGNQYGVFPSVSAGWRISEEPFFKPATSFINELKLRVSYGVVGNNNIPSYVFLSTFQTIGAQNFSSDGTRNIGYSQTGLPNPNIKWESLYETNIGIDAALFNSRLTATIEWYDKTTRNVLYNIPIPLSTGVQNPTFETNIGTISNRGVEISLNYRDKTGQIGYSIGMNGAFNRNKVVSLDGINKNPFYDGGNDLSGGYGVMTGNSISVTQAGEPFSQFYGYRAEGIYQNEKQISEHPQFAGDTANVGDLIFADVNHDGKLDANDRTVLGNPNPSLIYGISLSLTWKGFDIAMLWNGIAGVQIFNGVKPYAQYIFSDGNTTSQVFNASFLGNNKLTSQPRIGVWQNSTNGNTTFIADPNGNYRLPNSYFVENGSYLKLKNLQIGYTISTKLLEKVHISSARIFLMANNLFAITRYSGLDPELGGSVTAHGIDSPVAYPHTRVYSCGIDLSF